MLAPPFVGEFARLAERHGYAGIAFTDHPAPTVRWTAAGGEGSADPLVSLAYCAAVTSSIELMTFVLALPYHNPFRLAHQAATLDALSGGRLTLGLGTGYLRGEMRAMGADPGLAAGVVRLVLETMLTAWTAESVSGSFARGTAPGVPASPAGRPVRCTSSPARSSSRTRRCGSTATARSGGRGRPGTGAGGSAILTTRSSRRRYGPRTCLTSRPRAWRSRTCAAGARQAGRDPGSVALGLSGLWPMLDIRRGWDAARDRRGGPGGGLDRRRDAVHDDLR